MKNILKLGIVLTLYTTVACVGLAFVYSATEKIIAQRQEADLEAALRDLFPDTDGFNPIPEDIPSPDSSVRFEAQYAMRKGSALAGVALRSSGPSYGGPIIVLVGVQSDGRISGVKILEHADTPGLGANAASPSYFVNKAAGLTFYGQFTGKSVADPFEAKNDVAAITASTITSRAVSRIVKASGTAALDWMNNNGGGAQ
jgi:electron transport complex protein RnfG